MDDLIHSFAPGTTRPVRRLAAILVADVAGYARLMERDESGTHARIQCLRDQVVEPLIALHCGLVVRVAGDGWLVVFASAIHALSCAVSLQRAIAEREQTEPDGRRLCVRVGINVADILIDGTEIAGTGVNVAARLEAIAEPGGICVSHALKEQIHERLGVDYLDGGWRRVKNIEQPIHVFHVVCAREPQCGRIGAFLKRVTRGRVRFSVEETS